MNADEKLLTWEELKERYYLDDWGGTDIEMTSAECDLVERSCAALRDPNEPPARVPEPDEPVSLYPMLFGRRVVVRDESSAGLGLLEDETGRPAGLGEQENK